MDAVSPGNRIPAIDGLRGIAILTVVLFHFGVLRYGHLGVDLFFVISGFLVSRPLLEACLKERRLDLKDFFVRRATKILPSYFFFLAAGAGLAYLLYSKSQPGETLDYAHWPRYVFFYSNYRGGVPWSFAHLWSLCVEEHFYILLPLTLLSMRGFFTGPRAGAAALAAMILGSWILRYVSYRHGLETVSATHNRLDSLAIGVLLALMNLRRPFEKMARGSSWVLLGSGGGVGLAALAVHTSRVSLVFNYLFFHTLLALCFSCIFVAVAALKWRPPRWLSFFSVYSYNWYLWHALIVRACLKNWGSGFLSLAAYFLVSLGLAVAVTHLIENPCLKIRRRLLRPKPKKDPEFCEELVAQI